MKTKILFGLMIFARFFIPVNAQELSVDANIDSGEYNFVLEVYLNSNQKDSKIFYYTDGIGRFDTLKSFSSQNPIIIKENTTLDFYAMSDTNQSTKIQEKTYRFSYPKNLNLSFSDGKIVIKNNESKTINIGYYSLEGSKLNYEIYKNTFLNPGESFFLPYSGKENETITFYTPNNKKIDSYTFLSPKVISENIEIKEENTIQSSEISSQEPEKTGDNNVNIPLPMETQSDIIPEVGVDFSDALKASTIETKTQKNDIYVLLYGFVAFLFFMTLYNIFSLVRANKKVKSQQKSKK